MAEIDLVRQEGVELTEAERATVRKAIFGVIDGLGEHGQRQWRRLWNRIFKLQPGEMINVQTRQERLGWYHRKHMKLEKIVFENQSTFETFRTFRAWLKLGAGHVEFVPSAEGQLVAVPLSIRYADLEQAKMEEFHANAVEFLRSGRAVSTLWPHLDPMQGGQMIDVILAEFGEL